MQRQPLSLRPPPRPDWLLVGSIVLVALLVIFLAVMPGLVSRSVLRRDNVLTQRIDPMASSAASIAGLMVVQEASERGYVIAGTQSFLVPYTQSRSLLASMWTTAEPQATQLGGSAPELLAAVRRSATTWQTQAAEVEIQDVRSGYQDDAASAVTSGRSEVLFDQFLRDSNAFSAYLAELRSTQTAGRDRDLTRLGIIENVLVGLGLLALGLLVYAGSRYISLLRRVVRAEGEARFRNIVETANEGVWLLDHEARTILVNQRMADILGVGPEEVSAGSILDYCFPDDRSLAENHIDQNLRGRSEQFDFRFRRSDGNALSVLACTSPVRDGAGTVVGALGMFSDITARMQAERERNELLIRVQEARDGAEAARHRLSLLAAVSQSLAEAGNDLQAVIESATRETAETLGDGCVLRLTTQEAGSVAVTAVYHRDPAIRNTLLTHLATSAHAAAERKHAIVAAAQTSRGGVLRAELETEPDWLPQGFEIVARLVAPLESGSGRLGTLDVFGTTPGHAYGEDDQVLLDELADRIGLAIENARLYRDAVDALHTRDEFLSAITHDLRSPLTSVQGFAQLMLRRISRNDPIEPGRMRSWLTTIEKSTERMAAMINELLDLAQLRDGRPVHLNPRRIELVGLMQQIAEEARQAGERREIVMDAEPGQIFGFWDPVRLARALTNLLSNAIKYSPEGGSIEIAARSGSDDETDAGWAEVRVRDEGLGIPPEDLSRIFDRYQRGANVSGISGIGIGLAAARQIVEQHGGSLTAESELGQGSVFVMRLPLEGKNPDG
jgi:PAS domain S-box-containing protein